LRIHFPELPDIFRFIEAGDRKRLFYKEDPRRQYDVGFWEDCLYKVSEAEFMNTWQTHNIKTGYSVLFVPDFLIDDKAISSEIYNWEKYLPGQDLVIQTFEALWPQILLVLPAIPLHGLASVVHDGILWLLDKGWDAFKGLVKKVWTDDYPLEGFLGISLDLLKFGPILKNIYHTLIPWLYDAVCRVRVTWKYGYSNGYDHSYSTWKKWAFNRRIYGSEFHIDSEVVYRCGEMLVVRYWRSNGADPVISSLTIPKERRCILVADIMASYDRKNGLGPMSYFPMY
jgi:hypothetical protein